MIVVIINIIIFVIIFFITFAIMTIINIIVYWKYYPPHCFDYIIIVFIITNINIDILITIILL